MTFIETRGMLAKLLATENLIIEHDNTAQTASFNTQERILTLPVLKTENENVYNLFVAHETGHALYTPPEWADEIPNNVPYDFVNVIEDVRIEKLIQNKFPGLRTDFTRGYDKLNDDDFFGVKDKNLSDSNLIDRINLHFKLGVRAFVPFSEEEQEYVELVNNCETYDDVVEVAAKLAQYIKDSRENPDNQEFEQTEQQSSSDSDQQSSSSQMKSGEDSDEQSESDDKNVGDDLDNEMSDVSGNQSDLESETQQSLDSKLSNMTERYGAGYEYVNLPTEGIDFIVKVDELRKSFHTLNKEYLQYDRIHFDNFINSIKRDVNFLVQQFEMKKSADAYARTTINKTGELDMSQLHAYKLTDDLFLRQSVTPDGKNHGMIMYLDWSGSMDSVCHETVKQILLLVQFCRKAQIPFEVYTFTSGNNYDEGRENYKPDYKGRVILRGLVHMVQVLSSSVKRNDLETDMFNLWCQSRGVNNSHYLQMGGTPLDNALFALPDIVNEFRANTKAQKVSFVCVTDGETSPISIWEERRSEYNGEIWTRAHSSWNKTVMIRDGAKVIPVEFGHGTSGVIAKWLESKITDLSITHIYLGSQSVCERYARNLGVKMDASELKKQMSTATKSNGWSLISFLNPKGFNNVQDEIKVDAGESKAKIKAALKKYLKSKSTNKVVLSALAGQFA